HWCVPFQGAWRSIHVAASLYLGSNPLRLRYAVGAGGMEAFRRFQTMDVRLLVVLVALGGLGKARPEDEVPPTPPLSAPHIVRLDVSKLQSDLRALMLALAEAGPRGHHALADDAKEGITLGQAVLMVEMCGKVVTRAETHNDVLCIELGDGTVMKVY